MSKVVIIGSGLGGLTAGILAAQQGHATTIFESHDQPGGYVAGFRRQGFYFESGTLSFEASNQVFKAMRALGVYDRVEFVPQRSRFLAPEFDFIPAGYPEFKEAMLAAFPSERERLEKYFKAVEPLYRPMKTLMAPGAAGPAMAAAGLSLGLQYLKYRNATITDFTARFFERDSRLFRLFRSFGYPDMSVWILGGAMATIFNDYWTVRGGMQSWADALAARFQELGGEIKLKTKVDKILTRGDAATGVSAGGQTFAADWVISGCDYKQTFLSLLDNRSLVPGPQLEKIKTTAVSEGIATVYLGLGVSSQDLMKQLKMPHVMYLDELPGMDIHNPADPEHFRKCSLGLYSPSLHNPDLAPPGKSSLMLQATAPYHWMDNWGGGDRERYRALKEGAKRAMIAKAAKVITGLEGMIEFSEAATPLTYQRFTGNSDGATSAWSWNPHNKFYRGMGTHVDTPVKRLLIGSCWATQIGGIPGAIGAGQQCANRIK